MPSLSEILGKNITTVAANSRVAKALAAAGVAKTPELTRVLGLPRRKFDAEAYPSLDPLYARSRCLDPGCPYCVDGPPRYRPIQSAMVIEASQCDGAFLNVGVGKGKTLSSLTMHKALESTRSVLLVPAQLRDKTLEIDGPALSRHFDLAPIFPASEFHGQSGIFVLGYEELSATRSSDLLDRIQPDLIVADECHKLKNSNAARTKRFLRFCRKNPVRFVGMTGSAMSKCIMDFAHLIELALGKGSPLPRDYPSRMQWADCIVHGRTAIGALVLLCQDDHETAREAFQRRFIETPGVIVTQDPSLDLPIEIKLRRPKPPDVIKDALDKLESSWAWDGEEYDGALEICRLQREIVQGFFYRLIWPDGKDDEWTDKRNAWRRAVRARLGHTNRVGADSPALLEQMAESGEWCPPEWIDWLGVRDRPEPPRETIELSRWILDEVSAWGLEAPDPGIIWVDSPVVGEWLAELGIPFYGAGSDAEVNELAEHWRSQRLQGIAVDQPTIALSWRAHSTGKNLQAWARNLVLYPPADALVWEQLIGRTHRPGQLAPAVQIDIILSCPAAQSAWTSALEDAERIEGTVGQIQRLNLANIC